MTSSQARGGLKRVAILGSTGSIGTQALDVIAAYPQRFAVAGLAAGHRADALVEQANRFRPDVVSICEEHAADVRGGLRYAPKVVCDADGLLQVALESRADILLAATDGFVAFEAVLQAAERGVDLAIANKELIVAAGTLLMNCARAGGARVIPVDSEHSAIFQCLEGEDAATVSAIVLTASGGPFWRKTKAELEFVTLEQALCHPTWQMGVKNTIDSATMMNKGLEVIEAAQLFAIEPERIEIVVHPQSIAHGAIVFSDGSVKMQVAAPDMRLPIGYALAYPNRLITVGDPEAILDPLVALGAHVEWPQLRYDFERPDPERFPCIALAYKAAKLGKTAPAVLSAANEIAVGAFVKGEIGFTAIPTVIERVLCMVELAELSLENVRLADAQAREAANEAVRRLTQVEV